MSWVGEELAASPDGIPLGVLRQEMWARPVEELGKRKQRNSKAVAEKESQRWLDGVAVAEAALCGHPQVVMVADREADIYDLFAIYLGEPAAQPVEICFLWAHEEHPPRGQTPISWLLATTVPIESLEDALRVLGWYACRGSPNSAGSSPESTTQTPA